MIVGAVERNVVGEPESRSDELASRVEDLVGTGFGCARVYGCVEFDKPYFSGESIVRFTSDSLANQCRPDPLEFAVRVTQHEDRNDSSKLSLWWKRTNAVRIACPGQPTT